MADTQEPTLHQTPLRERHEALGARMIDFAGWLMPVQYAGILEEHRAVRERAGLFDLSHMGELFVLGPEAGPALARALVTNPPALADGRAQYSMIVAPDGGIIDDLIVYRLSAERYLVVANASNAQVVSDALAERAGARFGLESRLFGETEAERGANQAFIEALLARLLTQVRRFVYHQVLPDKRALMPTVTFRAPTWERAFVGGLYPAWRMLMARGLDFSPQALADAPVKIEEALTLVEAELARRKTPFLGGAAPGELDVIFSALAGPLVFPRNYGARLPAVEDLPEGLRRFIAATRARPAGDLIIRTYDAARFPRS